jgi:ATP-dependent helicase/nuclease subunit A
MERNLTFQYAHQAAVRSPSKQTATERKGREKDMEAAENTPQPPAFTRSWRRASFDGKSRSGKDYGVAMHNAMAYLRYENCESPSGIRQELDRLVQEGYIRKEQQELISCERIAAFFETTIGKRLIRHPNVLREFKFSLLEDGTLYDPALAGEQVLLQGVVDCAVVEDDGIILIDFKTDSVTDETLAAVAEGYRFQLEAYAGALERIYEKKVKQSLLYFFKLNSFVEI